MNLNLPLKFSIEKTYKNAKPNWTFVSEANFLTIQGYVRSNNFPGSIKNKSKIVLCDQIDGRFWFTVPMKYLYNTSAWICGTVCDQLILFTFDLLQFSARCGLRFVQAVPPSRRVHEEGYGCREKDPDGEIRFVRYFFKSGSLNSEGSRAPLKRHHVRVLPSVTRCWSKK